MRVWVAIASAVVLGLTFAALQAGPSLAHDPTPTPEPPLPDGVPPIPIVYSGTVLVAGSTPPDGLTLTARIEGYEAEPVAIVGGHFRGLTVGVDDSDLLGRLLTFYLNGEVPSDQTVKLVSLGVESLELTFPRLPTPPPTPTPTPTAAPTSTPTPRSALPAVYSGPIVILGGTVSPDAELVARVGGYVSIPAVILENSYLNLVIAPNDMDLLGEEVTFLLDGIEASTTDTYESGKIAQNHTLVFVGVPTPTNTPTPRPTSTPTPVPTSTPTPVPTNTPTPKPTSTPTPVPTNTPTPVPTSTPTPVPTSTPTPVPASTPTPVPTNTPTPVPTSTPTPVPTSTPTPVPTNTPKPVPTSTPTPVPTNTPTPEPSSTPLPVPTVSPPAPVPTATSARSGDELGSIIFAVAVGVVALAAIGGIIYYVVAGRRPKRPGRTPRSAQIGR